MYSRISAHALAGRLEALLELGLGLDLRLAERHLHAAVRIDLAFAGSLDGQEDHVLEFVDHRRLHPIGLRRRHAAEWLQRQHHVAELVHGVVDVLADFEVPFAAARELVVEGMRQFGQFRLRHQVMRDAAQILRCAVVEETPHPLARANAPQLLAQADVVREMLFQLVPLRVPVRTIDRPFGNRVRLGLVHQVGNPGGDGLDQHLRAFALQEFEHVEVAVALGGLRPEFAGDLHHAASRGCDPPRLSSSSRAQS